VRPPYNPQMTPELREAVSARAQAMIGEGASYDQIAGFLYKNGIAFTEKPLRDAAAAGHGRILPAEASNEGALNGLAKGATHSIDRAAEGLESGVNSMFGTAFDSAAKTNREREAYFATHPTDDNAATAANIATTAAQTWRMGPMLGGAVGNVLAGDSNTPGEVAVDAGIGASAASSAR
jgi:hypothetical protein